MTPFERPPPGDAELRALLQQVEAPDPIAEQRVRARVRQTLRARSAARPRLRALALGAALATAGALLLLRAQPAPLDLQIDTPDATTRIAVTRDVHLEAHGRGQISGTEQAPRIEWSEGQLSVEVTPKRGIDLTVETGEGVVAVVGTAFTVTRDALGTALEVSRGEVALRCDGQAPQRVRARGAGQCLPTRPAGLLGRARVQAARGEDADQVLATLNAADRAENPAALAGEILAFRVDVLRRADRDPEALDAALAYLSQGHAPRRAEVRQIAIGLLLAQGGCARALPLLREAAAESGAEADRSALAACQPPGQRGAP